MHATYVLAISDDEQLLRELRTCLSSLPHISLQECSSFRSALPRIRIERYDCIIVDKNLEGGDGISLAPIAKRVNPSATLILVLPENYWAISEAALSLGFAKVMCAADISTHIAPAILETNAHSLSLAHQSAPNERRKLQRLSEREREILVDISQGKRNYEIAALRHISEGTIKSHLTSIYRKLEVRNRVEAISLMNH